MDTRFELLAVDSTTQARAGVLRTAHGPIETPVFMPVGTRATVKSLSQEMLEQLGARIILGNAYHLYLRPGHEVIRALGGLHRFMGWDRAILTDSGGFQIYSLAPLRKLSEEGVEFRSHLDGSWHSLTPEKVVDIQVALGSDIVMVLDECQRNPCTHEVAQRAASLTRRWARRSKERFEELGTGQNQALFGILQGSTFLDLRRENLEALLEIGFDGYAIGGLSVGEEKSVMYHTVEAITPLMPKASPRYLMGVGSPADLIECVARGVDMFDCVMPTRNARNGQVFTGKGPLNIKKAVWLRDKRPIDEACACLVCQRYSRAYLRHLYVSNEILSSVLCTYHNLFFYLDIMRKIRQAIRLGNFVGLYSGFINNYKSDTDSRRKEAN